MDRFSICEAYWCFMVDWNKDGLTARCRAKGRGIGVQLHRMQFRPGMCLGTDGLEEDARAVYDALVEKYHPEAASPPRARCPACGIPTVPDSLSLTIEEAMCDSCNARAERHAEQQGRYIDAGPLAWDDQDSPDH